MEKNMAVKDFVDLVKIAIAGPGELTYDDVARLRKEMDMQGVPAPYEDETGELKRIYNAHILHQRDKNIDAVPEIEGATAGVLKGTLGAGLGVAGGYGLGNALHNSGVLNLRYGLTSKLPTALAFGGGLAGGLLGALPAAHQKYEATKALKKLQLAKNMRDLQRVNNTETNLVNS